MNFLSWYNKTLLKYPLRTKCLTSGFLFGLGDILTQTTIEKKSLKELDTMRTTRMASVGLLYAGPVLHVWYTFGVPYSTLYIIKTFGLKNISGYKQSLIGMSVDQTIFASSFLVGYFSLMNFSEKFNFNGNYDSLKGKLWPTMITNWKIWPLSMFLIFNYSPIHLRLLFANFVGLFWNMYLSYINFKKE